MFVGMGCPLESPWVSPSWLPARVPETLVVVNLALLFYAGAVGPCSLSAYVILLLFFSGPSAASGVSVAGMWYLLWFRPPCRSRGQIARALQSSALVCCFCLWS